MKYFVTLAVTAALLAPAQASAQSVTTVNKNQSIPFSLTVNQVSTPQISLPKKESKPKSQAPAKPQPVVYTVTDGDNLSKIGSQFNVEWQRIWSKNTQLSHPDKLNVGDQLTIPAADEVLQRDIPAAVSLPAAMPGVAPSAIQKPATAAPVPSYSYDAGNTYDYGYCTWYVKNRRGASIPNSLGNANTWYARAAAMGMAVGSTPAPGAVGTTTRGEFGHVVYVESVNGDGSINISEMNAPVFGGVTYRTASASEFVYIY